MGGCEVEHENFLVVLASLDVSQLIVRVYDSEECAAAEARRLVAEAFGGIQVAVESRWGLSPDIATSRGVPQGSISGPEESKPAQEPVLRLRESSSAKYVTAAGRRVACAAYFTRPSTTALVPSSFQV